MNSAERTEIDEMMTRAVNSCDERIANAQSEIAESKQIIRLRGIIRDEFEDDGVAVDSSIDTKHGLRIKNRENDIKLLKIEKMLYIAVNKPNTPKALFNIYCEKYAEVLTESIEWAESMVKTGIVEENEYLEMCNVGKRQKSHIDRVCDMGRATRF